MILVAVVSVGVFMYVYEVPHTAKKHFENEFLWLLQNLLPWQMTENRVKANDRLALPNIFSFCARYIFQPLQPPKAH